VQGHLTQTKNDTLINERPGLLRIEKRGSGVTRIEPREAQYAAFRRRLAGASADWARSE
jgi:hypothetical protein